MGSQLRKLPAGWGLTCSTSECLHSHTLLQSNEQQHYMDLLVEPQLPGSPCSSASI
jgi:hypothetical protein